ncbi:energy-coupling factor transporter transmembrane protein EcfT [Actinotalea sp. BY-33]|uniref:Energy-coupling factor transporter transmembrane protein EcfT n=1 Tax=Actinotalea soli TaxID=2819234 RepID=A0A939RT08_9CELL|nr:energy-coupling factor transporter transmembrane protein EcfT [Actinotalea soli]MBO1750204.1 energy-coupling factor transporter transmembrane protein EcfT [Actinotalea soli]
MRRRRAQGPRRPPWTGPLGLFHAGSSWLHRVGPGPKVAGLGVLGIAVVALTGVVTTLALALVTVATAVSARLPLRSTTRAVLPVLLTAATVGAYQVWQRGPAVGLEVGLDLVTLVLAATVVTATTRADELLDALVRGLGPLRRVGLRPEVLAMAIGLMLRAVPGLLQTATEVREAARARGLERDPRATLAPAAVRAVARARSTGEALAARGVGD